MANYFMILLQKFSVWSNLISASRKTESHNAQLTIKLHSYSPIKVTSMNISTKRVRIVVSFRFLKSQLWMLFSSNLLGHTWDIPLEMFVLWRVSYQILVYLTLTYVLFLSK